MKYEAKTFTDRTGKSFILKSAEAADAEALIRYMKETTLESPYLLREADEVTMTVEQEISFLEARAASPVEMLMTAVTPEGKLMGNCSIMSLGDKRRTLHRCGIAIALYQEYTGCGVGTVMLGELLKEAAAMGYEQAELEVVSTNQKAIALYTKLGFVKTGVLPHNLKYADGTYADCDFMVKDLR